MRKLVYCVALVFLATSPAGAQTNLVRDGGFEAQPAMMPGPWFPMACPAHLSMDAHSGSFSLALAPTYDAQVCPDAVGGFSDVWQWNLSGSSTTPPVVSLWAKALDPNARGGTVLEVSNGGSSLYGFQGDFTPSTEWQLFTLQGPAWGLPYAGPYTLMLRGRNVLIDDVAFTVMTTPEPTSVALLSLGLIPVGVVLRRRR